jgi:hypothetical protein
MLLAGGRDRATPGVGPLHPDPPPLDQPISRSRTLDHAPPGEDIVVDPGIPGRQGPTFTGRERVPPGETFSARPETGYSYDLP